MGGEKPHHSEPKMSSGDGSTIGMKIVIHSRRDPCGDKFLKYMQLVSYSWMRTTPTSSRSAWTELRTNGALTAIMEALKKIFTCDEMKALSTGTAQQPQSSRSEKNGKIEDKTTKVRDICNMAFSILSNAFSLDYLVRSDAINNGFISSLQQFISVFTQERKVIHSNTELISRAVKCVANLSNDSNCRECVLRTGVAISILRILEFADNTTSSNPSPFSASIYKSSIRAVRILSADSNGKDHVLKFGGLETIMDLLAYEELSTDNDFILDVIRSLNFLSTRIKNTPSEVIDKLIYNPEVCKLRNLVRIFENLHPGDKLYSPVTNCLINLSSNKEISNCLGGLRIFQMILQKLGNEIELDLLRLLVSLTKNSSFNQTHLTTSPLIGSTLKILKTSRYKEYHEWLLNVYEKLYAVSLPKLIECGLVIHMCDILRQELEDCDYDSLRKKISSLDDCKCSVHKHLCPFVPVYRCSSPSYQQIQEEMKSKLALEDIESSPMVYKKGEDSLSPFSSPNRSIASGGSSPTYSETSAMSLSSVSDDEGCYSPPGSSILERTICDKAETSPLRMNCGKRTKEMDQDSSSDREGDSDEYSKPKKLKLENDQPTNGDGKSLTKLKASVKKIVTILNILHKCSHILPFPSEMLQITPILLGIIVRGKVSLMPQHSEYQTSQSDDELRELSRRTFEVSYKIILQMASIIQNFRELIVTGIIPVLVRLEEPVLSENVEQMKVVQEYCAKLIHRMVGFSDKPENNTAGWREGYIMRTLLVNNNSISPDKINQMVLNIPLLYKNHADILRKFEMKAKSWTKILEMLINSDESSFYRFEDCALALCSICSALGVKWKPMNANVPQLQRPRDQRGYVVSLEESTEASEELPEENVVKLSLDDKTSFYVNKDLLIQASPVFVAMFNGHFIEAGRQKVNLPNVSKSTVSLLLDQMLLPSESGKPVQIPNNLNGLEYDVETIFELFSLTDQFLLGDIHERALNTLVTQYICPYSAPLIYAESVKLVSLQKSKVKQEMLGDASLNMFILKYVLTAENIGMSERCNAIRKMFDAVVPEYIVKDLKSLIEDHMYKA